MRHEADTNDTSRRRWLCVAYAFPPMNRSGTHRTVGFVRHLCARGWDATVLTVIPDAESIDETLSDRVPPSTRIVRTRCGDLVSLLKRIPLVGGTGAVQGSRAGEAGALRGEAEKRVSSHRRGLREWVSRLLQTPDSKIGWIPSAVRAGILAIRRERSEVIYSTSPYVSAHLVALVLKWWTKLPWVADFRDPWGDNPFRDQGFESIRRLDGWLERLVLRNASHVVMNTSTAHDALCGRLPQFAGKCSTITNGIDADLIAGVAAKRVVPESHFALTHCGQFYGPRTPRPWFDALGQLRAMDPALAARIRFVLVGPESYEGRRLTEIALDAGVDDLVIAIGARSHAETLAIMAGSDALALATSVGPGSDLQIPNKLFEYLGMEKPIVAAIDPRSPGRRILEDVGLGSSVCEPGDALGLAKAIRKCIEQADGGEVPLDTSAVKDLGRARQAASLVRMFDRLVGCASVDATLRSPSDAVEDEGVGGSLALDRGFGAVPT